MFFETIPSLKEAEICAQLAEEAGCVYGISFSCMDGYHTSAGDNITDCAVAFSSGYYPGLQMLGVNCVEPADAETLVREMKKGTALPVSVYPNRGLDKEKKEWKKPAEGDNVRKDFEELALRLYEAGASAVGGCCGTDRYDIEAVGRASAKYISSHR